MKWPLLPAVLFSFATAATAAGKKPDGPIVLKLVTKSDKYKFDGGGKTPAEYKQALEEIAKKQATGGLAQPPRPPEVDLVLQLTNTSKEDVTIRVGGDTNVFVFELTGGAGVVSMNSGLAFTTDFKLPKEITLAAGKSYEIPVKLLADGSRGASRFVYWTGPGEYKLSAKYTLSDRTGTATTVLTSKPVKITVTEK